MIVGWGIHNDPLVFFGDKRIQFQFKACFAEPSIPIAVSYLEFEIQTQAGQPIHRVTQPTMVGGQPLLLGAGHAYEFIIDVSLDQMSSEFVKQIKPGARGLTTRQGNMHLTQELQALAHRVKQGEGAIRDLDAQKLAELKKNP